MGRKCDLSFQTEGTLPMRFDLTNFEWSVIQPVLLTKVRDAKRVDDRRVLRHFMGAANRRAVPQSA